jgi:RimJ/RimL family protein N-acetyltransferase
LNRIEATDAEEIAFETERLFMRSLLAQDETLYCDLYSDAETMRFIGEPLSRERAARSFRKALSCSRNVPGDQQVFVIVDKAARQVIGLCGTQPFDAVSRSVEAGMVLRPEAQSKGYATEGLAALVSHAFSALPIEAVWVQYSREHMVAERLVISVGFKRCADGRFGNEDGAKCVWSIDRSSRLVA